MYIVDYNYEGVKKEGFNTLKDAKKAAKEWLKSDGHEDCVVDITKYAYTENTNAPRSDHRYVGKKWTLERSLSTDGEIYTDYSPRTYLNRRFKTWVHYSDVEIESRLNFKTKEYTN